MPRNQVGRLRTPILLLAFLAVMLCVIALSLLVTPKAMIEIVDAFAISFSVTVSVSYGSKFWQAFKSQDPDIADLIICGIAGAWSINALDRLWRLTGRVFDLPDMMTSPVIGFFLAFLTFFAALHLVALGRIKPSELYSKIMSVEAERTLFFSLLAGVVFACVIMIVDYLVHSP